MTSAEVYRYANLGMLIIGVSALGASTFTIFAIVVLNHFYAYIIPFALGWGMLIFFIDRSIVTEPQYRERDAGELMRRVPQSKPESIQHDGASPNGATADEARPDRTAPDTDSSAKPAEPVVAIVPPSAKKGTIIRAFVYLARVIISICLAFLVAETIILLIYNPEIESQLATLHSEEFGNAVATFVSGQKELLNEYGANLATDTKQQVVENNQVNIDRTTLANEGRGVASTGTTGKPGYGPQYAQDVMALDHDTKLLDKFNNKVATDTTLVTNEKAFIAGLNAQDPKVLAEPQAGDLARQQKLIYANGGFAAREQALNAYLKTTNDSSFTVISVWALRILLISFDLLPLGAKLLNPYTIYGRRMSERAFLIRYQDLVRQQALLGDIDYQAKLHMLWSHHNYQINQRQVAWRSSWRMNHMSDRR